jgi:hypothetical protein
MRLRVGRVAVSSSTRRELSGASSSSLYSPFLANLTSSDSAYGENLAASAGTGQTVNAALTNNLIKLWEDEASDYTPATPPSTSSFLDLLCRPFPDLSFSAQDGLEGDYQARLRYPGL